MKSIKELYRIGKGPSSSHTMGPNRAAKIFANRHPKARRFKVTLYGSLAATGKGHMTDVAITEVLEPIAPTTILWHPEIFLPFHPNGMKFESFGDYAGSVVSAELPSDDVPTDSWTVYSVGGGAISEGAGDSRLDSQEMYQLNTMTEIMKYCQANGLSFWEYVEQCEGKQIWDYLAEVWHVMKDEVERGLNAEGVLPGVLHLPRKAATYLVKARSFRESLQGRAFTYAYALAVSEENASGGTVVTAPTCGASGVLPAVLYHLAGGHDFTEARILRALATAGLFGNVVKHNASISGADVGCQGEVGVACAMASAAGCQLFGGTPAQIEYSAEMGLEHHLGMTCDPVCGLVQIPCIERNAFAAARALDCELYSNLSDGQHRVSFDHVVEVMKQTGHDLPSLYKETSRGGLAKEMHI